MAFLIDNIWKLLGSTGATFCRVAIMIFGLSLRKDQTCFADGIHDAIRILKLSISGVTRTGSSSSLPEKMKKKGEVSLGACS